MQESALVRPKAGGTRILALGRECALRRVRISSFSSELHAVAVSLASSGFPSDAPRSNAAGNQAPSIAFNSRRCERRRRSRTLHSAGVARSILGLLLALETRTPQLSLDVTYARRAQSAEFRDAGFGGLFPRAARPPLPQRAPPVRNRNSFICLPIALSHLKDLHPTQMLAEGFPNQSGTVLPGAARCRIRGTQQLGVDDNLDSLHTFECLSTVLSTPGNRGVLHRHRATRLECVSETAHGMDQHRARRIGFDLLP